MSEELYDMHERAVWNVVLSCYYPHLFRDSFFSRDDEADDDEESEGSSQGSQEDASRRVASFCFATVNSGTIMTQMVISLQIQEVTIFIVKKFL